MAMAVNKYLHTEGKSCGRAPVSRKLKFFTDSAGLVAAVVTDSAGTTLTQPVAVDKAGQIEVYSASSPLYYRTNAETGLVRKLSVASPPVDGMMVYRARHTAAEVGAGTGVAVPAIAGRQFIVRDATMRAYGGNMTGPTTVEITIETTGTVVLSHVTADLTSGVWRGTGTGDGTVVKTLITSGGKVTVGKSLLVSDSGGSAISVATHVDTIVTGYWTTT